MGLMLVAASLLLSHQLLRSTAAGSVREARQAGSQPAAAPTMTRTTAADTSVAGSSGLLADGNFNRLPRRGDLVGRCVNS